MAITSASSASGPNALRTIAAHRGGVIVSSKWPETLLIWRLNLRGRTSVPRSVLEQPDIVASRIGEKHASAPAQRCWRGSGVRRAALMPGGGRPVPLFAGDEIDKRRHAVVAGAFVDHTVVLGNFQRGEVAERLFQDGAGIEILDLVGPAGAVGQLLRAVALQDQPAARLERLPDAGKNFRTQRRVSELKEDRHDDVELLDRPLPLREVGLLGA